MSSRKFWKLHEMLHKWQTVVLLKKKKKVPFCSRWSMNLTLLWVIAVSPFSNVSNCTQHLFYSGVWSQTIFAANERWSFSCIRAFLLSFHSWLLLQLFFGSWYFRRLFLINKILLQCLVISLFWTKNLFYKQFPIEMLLLCTTWNFS